MKKVLIVEDVELNVDLLMQLLEDDYELITAGDGAQGVALAERERPDLIRAAHPATDRFGGTIREQITFREAHKPGRPRVSAG